MKKKRFSNGVSIFLTILMLFALHLTAEGAILLEELERPAILKVGRNNIYIGDGYNIKVFSKKSYKLIHILGKRGSGPGEFNKIPDSIQLLEDAILCSSPYKLIYFSYDGNYLKEVKTKKSIRYLKKTNNKLFTGIQLVAGKASISDMTLNLYNEKFEIKKILYRRVYENKNAFIDLFVRFTYSPFHIDTSAGKIIYTDNEIDKDFKINITDHEGKLLNQIHQAHHPVKFSKADKNKVIKFWQSDHRKNKYIDLFKISVSFPPYFPAICTWKLADDKIYIITFLKSAVGNECLIYDLKGHFLKKTHVLIKSPCVILYRWYPFDIFNGQFYQLWDNYDEESWELQISKVE